MGADHIEFVPSEPISGVRRFFTTNGRLLFNESDGCFYMNDSCLIVRLDSDSWGSSFVERPKSMYFSTVIIVGDDLTMDLYGGYGGRESRSTPLSEIDWTPGLGPAAAGVFPSAYLPWVDEQELLR